MRMRDVAAGLARIDEDRLREVQLARERLQQLLGQVRASVKTATWLPASGASVKTSATT